MSHGPLSSSPTSSPPLAWRMSGSSDGRHPLVYADWLHAPASRPFSATATTDVQPADPLELWHSPPFEPTIRDGNIYARGSADDRARCTCTSRPWKRCVPFTAFCREPEVPYRRGRRSGRPSIAKYVEDTGRVEGGCLRWFPDTNMYAPDLPTLNVGLRGLVYMEVEATGPARDLHSECTVVPRRTRSSASSNCFRKRKRRRQDHDSRHLR